MAPLPEVFTSPVMEALLAQITRIAPCDAPVLLSGETGVGKEIIARKIHELSQRTGRFIAINCAALPSELIESELFGTVRGAYTGNVNASSGLIASAHEGTLFLDELSEMPLRLQSRFLRVLEEMQVRRIGSTATRTVDFRAIAAINKMSGACMELQQLREDLYFRLAVFEFTVPPLRERTSEIPRLIEAYLDYYCQEYKRKTVPKLSESATLLLHSYYWPGNVRQLMNEMRRLVLLADEEAIESDDLSAAVRLQLPANEFQYYTLNLRNHQTQVTPMHHPIFTSSESISSPILTSRRSIVEQSEARLIESVLRDCNGNKMVAAQKLGLGRQTLYNKIARYNLLPFKPIERKN